MRRLALLVPLAALAAGCGVYRVNRSALAPHAAPHLHPAPDGDAIAEVSVGAASLGHVRGPEVGNPEASVEIPGMQLHADARLQVGHLAIGLLYQNGLDATAHKPRGNLQADVEEGDVQGWGVALEAAIPTSDPNLKIGVAFDLMMWSVPWVEWRTCVENCGGVNFTYGTSGRDDVTTLGIAVIPSYRTGNVTVFGGLSARNHPTIDQKGVEGGIDFGGDVESGPLAWTVSAGAQLDLGAVKGSLILYQTVTQDPVKYGPSAAALLTIPLGRRSAKAPAPPPGAPPPTPPPPPPGSYGPYPPAPPPPGY